LALPLKLPKVSPMQLHLSQGLVRIQSYLSLLSLALVGSSFFSAKAFDGKCPAATVGQSYLADNQTWQSHWQLDQASSWLEQLSPPLPPELLDYWNYVESQTDSDPWELISRQKEIFVNAFGRQHPTVQTFIRLEHPHIGRIRPISRI